MNPSQITIRQLFIVIVFAASMFAIVAENNREESPIYRVAPLMMPFLITVLILYFGIRFSRKTGAPETTVLNITLLVIALFWTLVALAMPTIH